MRPASRIYIGGTKGTSSYLRKTIKGVKGKILTREDAKEYIRKHGLVKVLDNEDGSVYDTPDKAFLAEHQGTIQDYSFNPGTQRINQNKTEE